MKIPKNYFEKVYAGWLSEVIGICLEAAVEAAEPLVKGCVGVSVENGSHCLYRDMAIAGRSSGKV